MTLNHAERRTWVNSRLLLEMAKLGWVNYTPQHGIVETPCLLPVINPNIRTIEPREMWDKYGIQALITNSYVIWKHEKLKSVATKEGVHSLLDYPE